MSSLMGNYGRFKVSFAYGNGAKLYTENNEEYLDFASGISVTNLGHNFKPVTDAVSSQAAKVIHTSNLYEIPLQEELADLIIKNSFKGQVFFCNSGAESNEAAIKLARLYGNTVHHGKKYKIISMYNSFHGRTYATMGATAQEKIQKGFTPMPAYNQYIPFNNIDALHQALALNDVCAIMLELFQGEGGVMPIDVEFLKEVRRVCDEHDILMILDEVQTGYGRTGFLFGYQLFGIEPDIMTLSKSIANGLPMGAVVAKEKVSSLFTPGTHGSTFGGNPLASAAACAVIKEMTKEGFLQSVKEKGNILKEYLEKNLPKECTIKGAGLLRGVKTPYQPKDVAEACLKNHLLIVPAGNNSVRLYPPLNISNDDLLKGAEIFVTTIKELGK
ncbi:MAG TPA: aspartate aminotransferase family protein [Candidatus Mucispirillum faecigallinarum]|uniref:Acetylornithine aminotransferase n=1 Tax=Candidatus Mucispirillum faecigallinarum TaxID=2838699 RepID=A0A9D2GW99_9BACT|nr:aspartate aminotransferase family protein [Candidatus Mucispirillum faecigallinarum]